ncbi:hypothetical protein GGR53DRAFT_474102 [Hypoxylon sp. FL1150]|nr:hypothetical protein GGR53DRAFT_474102 [Hypoxylon sp. FL1150]
MPAGSGVDSEAQWPPRSPHDVLLSTPKGRERLRRMAERTSPSPSPTKRGRLTPALAARSGNSQRDQLETDLDEEDDDEEDEEMLQLKLQAIQAKLKLKKLQSAKAKKADATRSESVPIPDIPPAGRAQPRESQRSALAPQPKSQVEVHVPASPVRRAQTAQGDQSPSRVRLGIDKGIKAKDISLKRAPSFKKPADRAESQNGTRGGYLRRAHTPALGNTEQTSQQPRPLTFSERLVAARSEEASLQERRERIKQVRSSAFELCRQDLERMKSNAKEIPDVPLEPTQYSRDEVVAGGQIKRSTSLRRPTQDGSRPESSLGGAGESQKEKIPPSEVPEEDAAGFEPYSSTHLSRRIIPHSDLTRNLSGKKTYVIKDLLKHVKSPDFQLPEIEQDIVVFGILASKSDPRTHKTNGNLKEKTETDPARGKYMVLQLVDLQWELELFLFNSGFERFWKLTPGTLLAILNPTIMPPPPNRTDTGKFSLVINSGLDTILEVGTARDLGYCKSIKKDGQYCNGWVNKKRTEFCEFHMNLGLAKHRAARQDVNAFNTGMGPRKDDDNPFKKRGGGGNGYHKNSRARDWEQQQQQQQQQQRDGNSNDPKKKGRGGSAGTYDRGAQGQWFIWKPSAASMLDNEVLGGGQVAGTIEKGEALRRRLATEEKERELMKSLGKMGSGAGREYMRRGAGGASSRGAGLDAHGSSTQCVDEGGRKDLDAKSLGLIATKGRQPKIHLSPVKRKRTESSLSNMSTATTSGGGGSGSTRREAYGWGGGLQDKLARMKDGERLRRPAGPALEKNFFDGDSRSSNAGGGGGDDGGSGRARSPARKKTRFITEKGIREAGRESLGTELAAGTSESKGKAKREMVVLDDDEDELEILR